MPVKRIKNLAISAMMSSLPKNHLSYALGLAAHWRGPWPLNRLAVASFARAYGLNLQEAEFPLNHYQSIAELFTRRLKPGLRPLGEGLVHPVDGTLTSFGPIAHQSLFQSKGKTYTLEDLLQSAELAQKFDGGFYLCYYLSPRDYHRFHSPLQVTLQQAYSLAGQLWPVNTWSVENIQNLFAINERVVLELACTLGGVTGLLAQVMVGATNVGSIRLNFLPDHRTNEIRSPNPWTHRPSSALIFSKGEELGYFDMGSSVILLLDSTATQALGLANNPGGSNSSASATPGRPVRMGESVHLALDT